MTQGGKKATTEDAE